MVTVLQKLINYRENINRYGTVRVRNEAIRDQEKC